MLIEKTQTQKTAQIWFHSWETLEKAKICWPHWLQSQSCWAVAARIALFQLCLDAVKPGADGSKPAFLVTIVSEILQIRLCQGSSNLEFAVFLRRPPGPVPAATAALEHLLSPIYLLTDQHVFTLATVQASLQTIQNFPFSFRFRCRLKQQQSFVSLRSCRLLPNSTSGAQRRGG